MSTIDAIKAALAAQGLRPAYQGERGWVVTLDVNGEPSKVWATDDPEPPTFSDAPVAPAPERAPFRGITRDLYSDCTGGRS